MKSIWTGRVFHAWSSSFKNHPTSHLSYPWPSNKLAVKYLEKAMNQGDKTSLQTVYFARALFKEGRKKEAKDLLTNLNFKTTFFGK